MLVKTSVTTPLCTNPKSKMQVNFKEQKERTEKKNHKSALLKKKKIWKKAHWLAFFFFWDIFISKVFTYPSSFWALLKRHIKILHQRGYFKRWLELLKVNSEHQNCYLLNESSDLWAVPNDTFPIPPARSWSKVSSTAGSALLNSLPVLILYISN